MIMSRSFKLIIEAILFSSDKPITVKEIHSCLPDAKISDIKSALEVLKYEYEAMGRSFELKDVASGYQFRSRSEYGPYILRMLQTSPNRLSRAAMETLAIIAYKQPILRHEIERLRGVDVGGILRTLLEKELIRIMGRKELPGRPLIYGTTKRFLETFDLKDLSSLPKLKEIKALGTEEYEPTRADGPGTPEEQTGEDTKGDLPPKGDEALNESLDKQITEERQVSEREAPGPSPEEEDTTHGSPSEEALAGAKKDREASQESFARDPAD